MFGFIVVIVFAWIIVGSIRSNINKTNSTHRNHSSNYYPFPMDGSTHHADVNNSYEDSTCGSYSDSGGDSGSCGGE